MSALYQGLLRASLIALTLSLSVSCTRTSETGSRPPTLPSAAPSTTSSPSTSPTPASVPPKAQSFSPQNTPQAQNAVASIETERCSTTQAIVSDPNPPLNVRSSPNVEADNVVGKINNGSWVIVSAEQDGWLEIKATGDLPIEGWIAKNRTRSACNLKNARIQFPSQGGTVAIADQFIGTGSHEYSFSAESGQTLTVTNRRTVFPMIFRPDGQPVIPGHYGDTRESWSGQLPSSGKYKIAFESNFKGYEYDVEVELR
jgi:hypothetical protein